MNSLKLELMKVRLLTFMRQTKNFACYLLSCAHPHTSKWTRPSAALQTESESCAVNLRAFWQLHHYMKEKTAILSKEVLSVSNCAWTEDLQSCKTWLWNTLWDLDGHTDTIRINTTSFVTEQIWNPLSTCLFWMWMLWIFLHSTVVPVTFMYEVYPRSYTRNAVYTENRCLGSACPVYIINTSILVTVWC